MIFRFVKFEEKHEPEFERVFQIYKTTNAFCNCFHEAGSVLFGMQQKVPADVGKRISALLEKMASGWLDFLELRPNWRSWDTIVDFVSGREEWIKDVTGTVASFPASPDVEEALKYLKDCQESLQLLSSQVRKGREGAWKISEHANNDFYALMSIEAGIRPNVFPFPKSGYGPWLSRETIPVQRCGNLSQAL